MLRRRMHRLTTALVVAWSLLCAQFALAAYVCPALTHALAMAQTMTDSHPCSGIDERQSVLCHQHCSDPGRTVDAFKLPAVPLPALVPVLELPTVPDAGATFVAAPASRPEARPPPDPLFLSTLRLRV
jgi:hypothetical protein